MTHTLKDYGLELRQAVNAAMRGDAKIRFESLKNDRIRAIIGETTKSGNVYSDSKYTVSFEPGVVQYYHGGIRLHSWAIQVDMKTLQWAHRTLEQYQVMHKLES